MRILHFIDTLGVGGAETLLKDTIIYYKERFPEDKHFVMTLYTGGGYEEVIKQNAAYFNLGFSVLKILPSYLKYRKFLRDNKIDLVHSHLNESTIIARFFTPESIKLVSTYHSGYLKSGTWNYSYKRLLAEKLGLRKSHYCLFVSNSVANDTIEALGLKAHYEVLNNFYDERFKPTYAFNGDQKLRLVTVGNLSRQKNQSLIINALRVLNNPGISLDIYGEGSLRPDLQREIDEYNLPVRLMGRFLITSEILASYDMFVLSSLNEGFGIALVEAMATGLPSLLSKVPALKEVAKDSAVFFENDNLNDLVQKINEIYKNKESLRQLSEMAISHAAEYSVEKNITQLNKVYKKL